MGVIQAIRAAVTSKSADDLRAELAEAEAAHRTLTEAWAEHEDTSLWRKVEDAARDRDQLRARLARAERLEREQRDREAAAQREKALAELRALADRCDAHGAFVAQTTSEIVALAAKAADVYDALIASEDEQRKLRRELADRARALGVEAPALDASVPVAAAQVIHGARLKVREQTRARGKSYETERDAAAMLEGLAVYRTGTPS